MDVLLIETARLAIVRLCVTVASEHRVATIVHGLLLPIRILIPRQAVASAVALHIAAAAVSAAARMEDHVAAAVSAEEGDKRRAEPLRLVIYNK